MFFFSVPPEKKQPKRELVARFGLDKMSVLHTVLRDSLRSNRSSHRLRRRVQSPHFIAIPLAIATLGVHLLGGDRHITEPVPECTPKL